MAINWMAEAEQLFRLVLAGVCGGAIGYERKNRLKEAGIRTHFIVSAAAALMMIISKYGFNDVVGEYIRLDPSRIAANIISSIGFLGAGIIFVRHQSVTGLTTAAGIWATTGVGMAIGSGMYILGVGSALTLILVQIILHKDNRWQRVPASEFIILELADAEGVLAHVRELLDSQKVEILGIRTERDTGGSVTAELHVKLPPNCDSSSLLDSILDDPNVKQAQV